MLPEASRISSTVRVFAETAWAEAEGVTVQEPETTIARASKAAPDAQTRGWMTEAMVASINGSVPHRRGRRHGSTASGAECRRHDVRITTAHALGRDGARQRLARFADGLATRAWPGGVDVRDIVRNWTGDRLDFSFTVARGFFSMRIAGRLDAGDTSATLDAEVPAMLVSLVGEERIREVVERELDRALGEP
jgi:hypothetical protein